MTARMTFREPRLVGRALRARRWSLDILPTEKEAIPKGLHHSAQGCEARATLGESAEKRPPTLKGLHHCLDRSMLAAKPPSLAKILVTPFARPNSLCGIDRREGGRSMQPFQGWCLHPSHTQGSSCLATLGSVISSFQDGVPRKMAKLRGQALCACSGSQGTASPAWLAISL